MSTESRGIRRSADAGRQGREASRRGLWLAFSVSESITLLSSWIALWLTVEVVPAETGFQEGNPLAEALLGWSQTGLVLFALSGLVVALGLLRMAGRHAKGRGSMLVLAIGAGTVAALSLIDAGWNILLLAELGGLHTVGTPGPEVVLFGAGAVAYLGAANWLFSGRDTPPATSGDGV